MRHPAQKEVAAIWIFYALLCAFFLALCDLCTKKFCASHSGLEIAFARTGLAVPVLWIFTAMEGFPAIDPRIWSVYVIAAPLELAAILLYIRAISLSPLSLTVPFLSFTPVFLLLTSPVILGEFPQPAGIAGIILIVCGAYLLNAGAFREGLSAPVRALARERGPLLMLLVALLYSVTANFGKMGVLYSSVTFFPASYFSLIALAYAVMLLRAGRLGAVLTPRLMLTGVLSAVMLTFHMMAVKLVLVSYMIAVKRTSLLFGILFGTLLLGEGGAKERIIAGLVMVAGILAIAFLG
jgi:uncharacterized membrane protein